MYAHYIFEAPARFVSLGYVRHAQHNGAGGSFDEEIMSERLLFVLLLLVHACLLRCNQFPRSSNKSFEKCNFFTALGLLCISFIVEAKSKLRIEKRRDRKKRGKKRKKYFCFEWPSSWSDFIFIHCFIHVL